MESTIKNLLVGHAQTLFGTEITESSIQFQPTRKDVAGDFTLVTFPFVKMLKCTPEQAGEIIGSFLKTHLTEIASYEVIKGFLNIQLADTYWLDQFKQLSADPTLGLPAPNSKSLIMVEYSSPNTNKPLHLGHLRNIFLGYSVSEILKAAGHSVVKTQIINDRGIHICKSMLAWLKYSPQNELGERENPANSGMKGDKLVGKYYVEFDKHLKLETEAVLSLWFASEFSGFDKNVVTEVKRLMEAQVGKDEKAIETIQDKIKEIARNQTDLMREAKNMLVRWEARDSEVYLLWQTMNGWVYQGFEKTYQKMEVDFDKYYYESDTYLLGKDVVAQGLKEGVFYQKEDGSVWIDLTEDGLDEKLLLRSDGTAVYITQDIGTAIERFNDYPDIKGMVYTVGNEQDYHFKVLFLILQKMGYEWAKNCFHLSYGMVDLPTGKMKSREGTVVDADDLMDEVIASATEMTKERGHLDGLSQQDKDRLYTNIGLGGLKYYLLKVDPKKRMLFNPAESIELNGHTGPFIQYAHARIKSLLGKSTEDFSTWNSPKLGSEEKQIIKTLNIFPEVIQTAATEYSPALLANYLFDLVKEYNHFYQSVSILSEEHIDTRKLRLAISATVSKVASTGMKLLGVHVPERM
ncbi:MAG: arginine--tRNA ligase [Crocinitomicaceae bacterium]|nr:arginine--tRNA ligase [Crocinitomicaceae bacterium]MCF8410321.1 arginine--tRNA ligase [Crocinitomicaceae bacterium]